MSAILTGGTMYIPINRIIVNKQRTSEEKVDDFVEFLERGRRTPPILVRKATIADKASNEYYMHINSGVEYYVLVDGRHRLAAHKILGKETIEVVVTL